MKNKFKYYILVIIIVASVHKPVLADPRTQQIQDERFQIEQRIEELDMQIEELMHEIQKNNSQTVKIKKDSMLIEEELKKIEEEIKTEKDLFNERVRVMYMKGVGGYLEVLLGANELNDFMLRIEALKRIVELDRRLMLNIRNKETTISNKKDELNKQKDILLKINNNNNEKLSKLKDDKIKQSELIEEIERQERLFTASIADTEVEINIATEQMKSSKKENQTEIRFSRGGSFVSGDTVVEYASKFLGTPYLWGGTTPAGFDCSGFTQYVYRQFGISIGRTTKNQIYDGFTVARGQLQPGDLVFYGKGGLPSHMGIYIGKGMYIHSPRTGDVVKISSYNRPDYITARRVIN